MDKIAKIAERVAKVKLSELAKAQRDVQGLQIALDEDFGGLNGHLEDMERSLDELEQLLKSGDTEEFNLEMKNLKSHVWFLAFSPHGGKGSAKFVNNLAKEVADIAIRVGV